MFLPAVRRGVKRVGAKPGPLHSSPHGQNVRGSALPRAVGLRAFLFLVALTFSSPLLRAQAAIEYSIPGSNLPYEITVGSDGALWFANFLGSIGRITTGGEFTTFAAGQVTQPQSITSGPDGALWFTEGNSKIGRLTTAGALTHFTIPSAAAGITSGPDGSLWFTELNVNKIGRITTAGVVHEFPIPTTATFPNAITAGPDGALWFTEISGNNIGRITTGGSVTEYPVPTLSAGLYGIVAGPDGNLWFNESTAGKVGRITTAGVVTEFSLPTLSRNFSCRRPEPSPTVSSRAPMARSGLLSSARARSDSS